MHVLLRGELDTLQRQAEVDPHNKNVRVQIGSQCHPRAPVFPEYQSGCIHLTCAWCGAEFGVVPVSSIAPASMSMRT